MYRCWRKKPSSRKPGPVASRPVRSPPPSCSSALVALHSSRKFVPGESVRSLPSASFFGYSTHTAARMVMGDVRPKTCWMVVLLLRSINFDVLWVQYRHDPSPLSLSLLASRNTNYLIWGNFRCILLKLKSRELTIVIGRFKWNFHKL